MQNTKKQKQDNIKSDTLIYSLTHIQSSIIEENAFCWSIYLNETYRR